LDIVKVRAPRVATPTAMPFNVQRTDMQNNEALADYQHLSIAFVNALDHREYDRVAPLFTQKGVFDRMGQAFQGREAIDKWLHSRPEKLTMRHILTNFELTPIAEDEMRGITYFTVYRILEAGEGPFPIAGPDAVGEYRDVIKREGGAWLIARREIKMVFQKA
jgi:hypothetical protein